MVVGEEARSIPSKGDGRITGLAAVALYFQDAEPSRGGICGHHLLRERNVKQASSYEVPQSYMVGLRRFCSVARVKEVDLQLRIDATDGRMKVEAT